MNGKLYRFHPQTGADAEDMTGESDEAKQEIAALIRMGGKLYWHQHDDGEYGRVEYKNIAFVLSVIGVPVECNELPAVLSA